MCETSFSEWPLRDFPSHTWRSTEFRIGHFVSPVCPVSWNWATVSWLATCCHFQELALQTCKGKKFKQRPFFLSLSLSSYIDRIELILALACRAQFSRQSSFFKKKPKKQLIFSKFWSSWTSLHFSTFSFSLARCVATRTRGTWFA